MFFIDTADIDYIKSLWDKLSNDIPSKLLSGVTTNPNAFSKINANSIDTWQNNTFDLCSLVSEIRGDNLGVVFVQVPNSNISKEKALEWIKLAKTWGDGKTKIGIKIPPFVSMLELNENLKNELELNVTGVADCSTALRAFSYGVRYVSIIPGRMEEKGIDAKSQIAYVNQRKSDDCEIITGSMRTIEGLKWACSYNTVPTIGTRVWDQVNSQLSNSQLLEILESKENLNEIKFSPQIDEKMTALSADFFEQMDLLGKDVYEEFCDK